MKTALRCLLAVLTAFVASVASAQNNEQLAKQAQAVLQKHCYACHGQDGSLEGGFSYVLDRQRLIDLEKVVPGNPEKSYLLERVDSDEMPPAEDNQGNKLPRMSDAEKETLKQWIAAGAPDFNEATAARDQVSPAAMLDLMAADLRKLKERDRPFIRYFTLTHLYNAGLAEDELQGYRIGLSKLVNSLSWGRRVVTPKPIDPAKTILRIDMRDYRWTEDGDKWDMIVAANPYGILYDTPSAQFCATATRTQMPYVRADWFVARASQPPLYHDVLGIPATVAELEADKLQVNAEENLRTERVARAGFNRSGVSQHNRLVERHESSFGAYWKSYDFGGSVGRQNLFENPLGPAQATDASGFLHDGGELIFNLPNGLQGYMLTDAAGNRIEKGPTSIVSDPVQPDRAVVNGLSCMSCHVRGMIYKADEIRGHVEASLDAFSREEAESILALYPPTDEFRTLVEEDGARFSKATGQCGVKLDDNGQVIGSDPVRTLASLFERELDLAIVAAEAGVTEEEFLRGLDESARLARVFGSLRRPSGTVKRDAYVANFIIIVIDLDLGELIGEGTAPVVDPTPEPQPPSGLTAELFAGRWLNASTSWQYTVRVDAGEPELVSVVDSAGDPFTLQSSVWNDAAQTLTWTYKSDVTGTTFEENVRLQDENTLAGDYVAISADGTRSPGTDTWTRASDATARPDQLAGRWLCQSSSAVYTFAVNGGDVALTSIVDDDGEVFEVLESAWDPQSGVLRWTYRVPSSGYSVAEVVSLNTSETLTGTWTSTPPDGGEGSEGSDSWTRINESQLTFEGRWLNASTQATYTIENVGGQPTLTSVVDDDGEVFVIQQSTFDGSTMRWSMTVPSTGYRVAEETTLQDGATLVGTWTSTAPDGTQNTGSDSWSRQAAGLAGGNGALFDGQWLCASSTATYSISFDGSQPRLIAILDDDGEAFAVESTSFDGTAMTWTYRVPSTGYTVEERVQLQDDDNLVGTWISTAPDGGQNNGSDSFSRIRAQQQTNFEGRWLDNATQAVYTISAVGGEPRLVAIVDNGGQAYVVQQSNFDGTQLSWQYQVPSTGYVVNESVQLQGTDTLVGNWSNLGPDGSRNQGSDTWSRIPSQDATLEGSWSSDSAGTVYTIQMAGGQPTLVSVVDDDGEVYEVKESNWDGQVIRWMYKVPSNGYLVREAVRMSGANTLTGNWTNLGPDGSESSGSDNFTRAGGVAASPRDGAWLNGSTGATYTIQGDRLVSVVDDDGEVYQVQDTTFDGTDIRWRYFVPSTKYTVEETVHLQDANTLSGSWNNLAPDGSRNQGTDTWTRTGGGVGGGGLGNFTPAHVNGSWLCASSQAVYTFRATDANVQLISIVDDDGEVFVVESSNWDGQTIRWRYKVPSSGYSVEEEARLMPDGTLQGTWKSFDAQGADSSTGTDSWTKEDSV